MSGEVWLWIMLAIMVVALLALLGLRFRRRGRASTPTVGDALAPPPPGSAVPRTATGPVADEAARGPHPGSALPAADGSAPSDVFVIKADARARRYHTPGSPQYMRARADLWFRSVADAEAAGYAPWNLG